MAVGDLWTPGADFATNEVVSAAKLNQQVRDNVYVLSLGLDGDTSTTTIKHRHLTGIAANRPAAGEAGRVYFATDTKTLSVDNGTTWDTPVTVVRKTANQTVTNDAVINSPDNNDTHLKVAMQANEVLAFELFLIVTGPVGADVKFAFDVPAAVTSLMWSGMGLTSPGTGVPGDLVIGTVITADLGEATYGVLAGSANTLIRLYGTVENGANAGDLQLMWAQSAADGTGTTILKNSWMKAHSIA